MTMKRLKFWAGHVSFTAFIFALLCFTYFKPNHYMQNVFAFTTWTFLVISLVGTGDKANKRMIQTHRDGKHAPLWYDFITYLVPIFVCASFGDFGKAFAWVAMMAVDLYHRDLYNTEIAKEQSEAV